MNINFNYHTLYKDNFNLYNLIKKINPYYQLFFDKKHKTYLIINSAKNYEICLKFNNFNQSILKILNFSRVENSKQIYSFVDINNEKLVKANKEKITQNTINKFNEIKHYCKRTKINKIKNIKKYIEEPIW